MLTTKIECTLCSMSHNAVRSPIPDVVAESTRRVLVVIPSVRFVVPEWAYNAMDELHYNLRPSISLFYSMKCQFDAPMVYRPGQLRFCIDQFIESSIKKMNPRVLVSWCPTFTKMFGLQTTLKSLPIHGLTIAGRGPWEVNCSDRADVKMFMSHLLEICHAHLL